MRFERHGRQVVFRGHGSRAPGILKELLEAITLKRLGQFTKPIVILDTNGYYEPLRQMLEKCVRENFMHPWYLQMWTFVDEPEGVIPAIRTSIPWGKEAIDFAVNWGQVTDNRHDLPRDLSDILLPSQMIQNNTRC
jgi:hypothetical protein